MTHCGTIFSQMLKIIPRHVFAILDKAHGTERKARRFSRWDQFVHLTSIQLTGRVSLRDGVRSMRSRINNFYHLGAKPVARSTFAEANEKRPAALRRVGYRDKETGRHYVFLTNNFDLAARTVADIYKERWQIETFFRFIKQNLKMHSPGAP